MLGQIFGSVFMCLVMAAAISLSKKGKRKYALITVGSFLTLIVALTLLQPVFAASGSNSQSDGWGNSVSINISYSAYGGSVNVKAHPLYLGGSLMGITIGCPIFYGEWISIRIYGYSSGRLVYFKWLVHRKGWQYDKSWTLYLPGGLDAVSVYTTAKFFSVPFGDAAIICNCFA